MFTVNPYIINEDKTSQWDVCIFHNTSNQQPECNHFVTILTREIRQVFNSWNCNKLIFRATNVQWCNKKLIENEFATIFCKWVTKKVIVKHKCKKSPCSSFTIKYFLISLPFHDNRLIILRFGLFVRQKKGHLKISRYSLGHYDGHFFTVCSLKGQMINRDNNC